MDLALLGRLLMALALAWFEHAQIIGQIFCVVQLAGPGGDGIRSRRRLFRRQIQPLPTHQQRQSAQAAPGRACGLAFDLCIDALRVHQQLCPALC